MKYPAIVLKKAAEQLNKRQNENKQISREKREKVYIQIPHLSEISKKIAFLMKQMFLSAEGVATIKAELKKLMEEREKLLQEYGYPANYLEDYYDCPLCRDEGFVGSDLCECYRKLIVKEAYACSNLAEKIKTENFDSFLTDIHSEKKNMEWILQKAKQFCNQESGIKNNLLFTGPTGTGKTFLSSCIAKEYLDQGFFVFYLSATGISNILDDAKFRRDDAESREYVNLIYESDLLILDDLGTEYAFGYPQSQLFDLLERRMISGKRTVISTNMNLDELNQKYSPRFVSRILGNYEIFVFKGKDLRYQTS